MLPNDAELISIDDHVVEHPMVWQDRLPERYREAGPRVIEVNTSGGDFNELMGSWVQMTGTDPQALNGAEVWTYEGMVDTTLGLQAVSGRTEQNLSLRPLRFDEIAPGCYDPAERVKAMDQDGVSAQLCFSTYARFAGTRFLTGKDKELALLSVKAYNNFILDEWCAYAPDRQIPLIILPLWDPQLCVAEIERTAVKGARAIGFPENPASPQLGLPSWYSRHWDPVFEAAERAEMPLCMHVGTSGALPSTSPDMPIQVGFVLMACNTMGVVTDLMYSGVFSRFPDLKVTMPEGGIGWVPCMLERLDAFWETHRTYQPEIDFGVRPSEMYKGHVYPCFIDNEHAGIEMRHRIGVDQILWESDYPHSDSNWPNSRKVIAAHLEDVPEDEARQIAGLNARRIFRWEN